MSGYLNPANPQLSIPSYADDFRYYSSLKTFANAETSAWVARVVAAGSTVSPSSAAAHDVFISAAKSGGFWSLISRLNTYGATTLAGALVPLVNTAGNATDTNHNFVSGDFSLTVGLTGDGATKYLDTGALAGSYASTSSHHLAVCNAANPSPSNSTTLGTDINEFDLYASYGNTVYFDSGDDAASRLNFSNASGSSDVGGLILGSRTGLSDIAIYRNSTLKGSSAAATTSWVPSSNTTTVFTTSGDPNKSNFTQFGYSFGAGLTGTQVAAYYAALNALMIGIGRGAIPV